LALILLVDDDDVFRSVTARMLKRAGHTVKEAGDGAQALLVLETAPPDIVVTDVLMPKCDGIELIFRLKNSHPDIRILALSARDSLGSLGLLNLARKVGADTALAKSAVSERLLSEVEELASRML
jgi:CheY-like chemotaxis protein